MIKRVFRYSEGFVKYVARLGIIFVAVIFAGKVIPAFSVDNQWYEFVMAFIIGGFNALIRTLIEVKGKLLTWKRVAMNALILNIIFYILIYIGAFSWLGVGLSTVGGIVVAVLIVATVSTICNHFKGFKTKIS